MVPAMRFAQQTTNGQICVSGQSGQYVYALFTEPANPTTYLPTVRYDDPSLPGRTVISMGRYDFGLKNCTGSTSPTYVVWTAESPPRLGNRYAYGFFDDYVVYYPKP